MIIQLCGLSGAGKSTLARAAEIVLKNKGFHTEVIDGDEYRKTLCKGLGFSKNDRMENIRRMAFVAGQLSRHGVIVILSVINPFEEMRQEIRSSYPYTRTIHIDCSLETLRIRDTKGLYRKAYLPDNHPEKISNLTGVNDPFEIPPQPDLYINTDLHTIDECTRAVARFIYQQAISQPDWTPLFQHKMNTQKNY